MIVASINSSYRKLYERVWLVLCNLPDQLSCVSSQLDHTSLVSGVKLLFVSINPRI